MYFFNQLLSLKKVSKPSIITYLYSVTLLMLVFLGLMRWPIVAGDTDLWYHLNGGRYISENMTLPVNSYFSFITPAKDWVDYFWLFQWLVYKVYSFSGYYGLIFLRSLIYLAVGIFLLKYLFKDMEQEDQYLYLVFIFSISLLFLLPRSKLVRPHLFSYLFILIFLYILEFNPQRVILLPILAVLWNNLHGIYYPVMLLIVISYLFEFLILYKKKGINSQRNNLYSLVPLIITLATIYVTPHGSKLIAMPFISTKYASHYIAELSNISLNDLLTFHISLEYFSSSWVLNLLIILILISIAISIARRSYRISHLFLTVGGLFLLTKGNRMSYELLLLSIPVLKNNAFQISLIKLSQAGKYLAVFVISIIFFLPFLWFKDLLENPPKYPFSIRNLPAGIATFLMQIPANGHILNHPNNGGYLQWKLYPRYKIFLDMEVPFLFTDEDFFIAKNVFSNEEVLRKILAQYNPSFITVPIRGKKFREMIKKYQDYTVIFFDQAEVLYVNKAHYPEIAKRYELNIVDPFEIEGKSVETFRKKETLEVTLKELLRIRDVYPSSLLINQVLAAIFNKNGEFKRAVPYGEEIILNFPELPIGYHYKGDSLTGLESYDEALSYYKKALSRADEERERIIYKQLGHIYTKKKQYQYAYKVLKKSIDIFSIETTYKDLYDLGTTAYLSGEFETGEKILMFAYQKVPPEDSEWTEKINKQLSILGYKSE